MSHMIGRTLTFLLSATVAFGALGLVLTAGPQKAGDDLAYAKREELDEIELAGDDDDGNSGNSGNSRSFTSGVNSNDRTGSGHTAVSRDRDRSRGDKTRDWTRDRTDNRTRDRSGGKTNDRSRNDSR
jgi:hypothetical protein